MVVSRRVQDDQTFLNAQSSHSAAQAGIEIIQAGILAEETLISAPSKDHSVCSGVAVPLEQIANQWHIPRVRSQ